MCFFLPQRVASSSFDGSLPETSARVKENVYGQSMNIAKQAIHPALGLLDPALGANLRNRARWLENLGFTMLGVHSLRSEGPES